MSSKIVVVTEKEVSKQVGNFFASKTPKKYIKTRPGPNGMVLRYVPIGYVITCLTRAFGVFWEWKILDKGIGKEQIWIYGELTIKNSTGFSITKGSFGGSQIKKSTKTQLPISIGNDLKSAESDALKKASSKFGIAADVFYKEMDQYDEMPEKMDVEAGENQSIIRIITNKLFAVGVERGFTPDEIKTKVKKHFKVESMNDLKQDQLIQAVDSLERVYEVVKDGEEPIKKGSPPVDDKKKEIKNGVKPVGELPGQTSFVDEPVSVETGKKMEKAMEGKKGRERFEAGRKFLRK